MKKRKRKKNNESSEEEYDDDDDDEINPNPKKKRKVVNVNNQTSPVLVLPKTTPLVNGDDEIEIEDLNLKHKYPKKRNFNPISIDTKLEKDEKFSIAVNIPIVPSFTENDNKYKLYRIFKKNLDYFSNNKKLLVKQNLGSWFAVWLENDTPKTFKGHSRTYVSSKSPSLAIISFGCNQDVVFERKKDFFTTCFGSEDDELS